jgi:hypothetical protein
MVVILADNHENHKLGKWFHFIVSLKKMSGKGGGLVHISEKRKETRWGCSRLECKSIRHTRGHIHFPFDWRRGGHKGWEWSYCFLTKESKWEMEIDIQCSEWQLEYFNEEKLIFLWNISFFLCLFMSSEILRVLII